VDLEQVLSNCWLSAFTQTPEAGQSNLVSLEGSRKTLGRLVCRGCAQTSPLSTIDHVVEAPAWWRNVFGGLVLCVGK
jgi:hypothetical protein